MQLIHSSAYGIPAHVQSQKIDSVSKSGATVVEDPGAQLAASYVLAEAPAWQGDYAFDNPFLRSIGKI